MVCGCQLNSELQRQHEKPFLPGCSSPALPSVCGALLGQEGLS